jgi:hypothetical protein
MSFIGTLETIGKDFAKGFSWAMKYALPVEKLTAILFPSIAPEMTAAASATTLIQNAVIMVEQKYAAAGIANGTGVQKLAEVMLLAGDAVTSLLEKAGITADAGYIQSVISAVVGILNVQAQPAS